MNQNIDSQVIEDIFIIDSENIYESQLVQQCFDIVGVFVAAVNLKGNITLINKKGREILGYTQENIVGENFIEKFISKSKQQETKELFNSVMENKSVYPENTKYYLQTLNQQQRIVEAKNITIRDKNNNTLGILISGEDVTDYVRNQHDLQKDISLYRILANNIPDINLYLFDEDLRFVLAEGSEMKKNGFTRNNFEGKLLKEVTSTKLKQTWKPLFVSAIAGKETSREYKFNNYYYLIWVIPLKNAENDVYSGIAITQNITDDKLSEQKLKKSKEEAEKANRAKSEFLARVSHEIRTPLNAILGFTEQLKQTELNKKQDDYVKIIDKSSEHLLSLINDILILSKIEARQISFDNTPFKIEYTAKYAHNTLMVKAQEKKLQFNYNIDKRLDKVLLGDSFRLRQILINLLSNAIKFTNSGYVELRCFLKEETDSEIYVRFDVIDTGIGISPEKLGTIFEQFKQADSSITKKYGGTGLGLTICKNLIELQNGSLSVTSQKGIGTTFTFVIPYTKGKETDIISDDLGAVDSKKLHNKRVLLVDDDSVNRLLGKTILEKFNCHFDISNNGKEALSMLNSNKYDIVLLDIHMPDISGIDVARHLRFEKKDNSTQIIAVTAAVMKDDIKKYFNAGINDFLIKPFKEIHLFNKMCELLNIKKQPGPKPKEEIILKEEISPKPYNLNELKKMTGNTSAMVKLINTFIENTENTIQQFQQNLIEKNWELIGEAAHKILPSLKHLEVYSLVNDIVEIKTKTIIEPDFKQVPEKLAQTIIKMENLIDQLKQELT
jgi:PAS domain S-box-containing protein